MGEPGRRHAHHRCYLRPFWLMAPGKPDDHVSSSDTIRVSARSYPVQGVDTTTIPVKLCPVRGTKSGDRFPVASDSEPQDPCVLVINDRTVPTPCMKIDPTGSSRKVPCAWDESLLSHRRADNVSLLWRCLFMGINRLGGHFILA